MRSMVLLMMARFMGVAHVSEMVQQKKQPHIKRQNQDPPSKNEGGHPDPTGTNQDAGLKPRRYKSKHNPARR
jgi:hypothetical protein